MQDIPQGALSGRHILVTGGASGIGLATALLFRREGASVFIVDANAEAVDSVAAQCGLAGAVADVTDPEAVERAVRAAVAALGGLDGIVNNAGISVPSRFRVDDQPLEGWLQTLSVNLTGPFLVVKAALPHLRAAGRATIVNVASGLAIRPGPAMGAYVASKAGLLAWTKCIAQELGPDIRVNATCPGPTHTPLLHTGRDANSAVFGAGRALERAGEADEQASAILYLTGSGSSYVTGTTLVVDGGRVYY